MANGITRVTFHSCALVLCNGFCNAVIYPYYCVAYIASLHIVIYEREIYVNDFFLFFFFLACDICALTCNLLKYDTLASGN